MGRRISWVVGAAVAAWLGVAPAAADVLPVPEAIARLGAPKEETHVLRSPTGAVLGDQRFQIAVAGQRLTFEVATHFTNGEEWDEHGEMDLAAGCRSRSFAKTVRRDGKVVQQQDVDFTTGKVGWLVDGVHAERTLELPPDTYIGPMMALVLGEVAESQAAKSSFEALVFRPDPVVVTLRAEAVDAGDAPPGVSPDTTTKLRLKADLGPVKNVLFASQIPTHYFWFTRASVGEFAGFAGKLSNGLEVVMTPETPATTTAHAR